MALYTRKRSVTFTKEFHTSPHFVEGAKSSGTCTYSMGLIQPVLTSGDTFVLIQVHVERIRMMNHITTSNAISFAYLVACHGAPLWDKTQVGICTIIHIMSIMHTRFVHLKCTLGDSDSQRPICFLRLLFLWTMLVDSGPEPIDYCSLESLKII